MAKNTYKSNTFKSPRKDKKKKSSTRSKINWAFLKDPRFKLAFGFFLLLSSVFLLTSFISYLFTGKADQSVVDALGDTSLMASGREVENWLGSYGAVVSHYFIFRWFGISAFFIPPLLFSWGFRVLFNRSIIPISSIFIFCTFSTLWVSLLLGYMILINQGVSDWGFLGGGMGYAMAAVFQSMFGWGTFLFLILSLFVFIIFYFNVTAINVGRSKDPKPMGNDVILEDDGYEYESESSYEDDGDNWPEQHVGKESEEAVTEEESEEVAEEEAEEEVVEEDVTAGIELLQPGDTKPKPKAKGSADAKDIKLELEEQPPKFAVEETLDTDKVAEQLVNELGQYDPTLDLSNYKFPTLDLLKEYDVGRIQVTQEELNQNKDRIVATLINFKIGIQSIKATIGPTVTLYEIVPEAGIKISRIKNLEDDIALSLAALGIRIIAPIPGRGTIGIEVPNKNREMVSIRSVLGTERFQKSDYELPVVLGKTISNEVFMIDLTKMPHLLVAGATGQGKSVGLNVILASLLYKRHPAQLKFVLVDPKKVEMSLFSKIERHFLAKLPNAEEAIITDTKKVVHTLNSLCIEMENRYEILKDAGAKNLREYNSKFIARKLNPQEGHRFLPYIVLVIDELADLMMTAGKEVETPIARLAQLARAIGIHLVLATQRPSVNVITGVIKANFPARLSFRVTSKVDSRTILDTGGADQLVGMGDMLLSTGSADIIRLQCAFIDTPEIEQVVEYIGSQRGYDSAYLLPEFEGDDEGVANVDLAERDALFEDAARLIVGHQQGSTSLIQRKMKLGYNRAGRLIDQLEAAGIVGPFEGSKAREVLIRDETSLEQLLSDLKEKHGQY